MTSKIEINENRFIIKRKPVLIRGELSELKNEFTPRVTNSNIHIPKPILKWVGGKTQILDKLVCEFPVKMHNYHEIFLGGGSVLFMALAYIKAGIIQKHGCIYAYDLNEPLVYMYKNIQSNPNELFNILTKIIQEFNACGKGAINRKPRNLEEAKVVRENYYYWIRQEYNKLTKEEKTSVKGSALLIFLNKTGFRGVFRVGPNGYNVPYGHYDNPEVINREHLDEIHELIQGVKFECCDFKTSLLRIEPDDFVYLDPPYAPETEKSFVGYTENGFNLDEHKKLFQLVHRLTSENKKMLFSNADVSLVRENFNTEKYTINSIVCKRAINSKNPDSKTREVIIKNY